MEKKNADSKVITHLNVDGRELKKQSEIRVAQTEFYENLYDRRDTNQSSINFFNDNMNKLDSEIHHQ